MMLYLRSALLTCRFTGVEPSFLLHPLDLLGGEDVPQLAFFPGMDLSSAHKTRVFERVVAALRESFTLVDLEYRCQHADPAGNLPTLTPVLRIEQCAA